MIRYGWHRDNPDQRDFCLALPERVVAPTEFALGSFYPKAMLPIQNQLNIGSCTFNAGSRAVYFTQIQQGQSPFMASRLQWYYWGRFLENTVASDSGCSIRNGFKALNTYGVCREDLFPYTVTNLYKSPTDPAIVSNAALHKAVQYQRVQQNINALKGVLSTGHPIVFGIAVYESFDSIGANGLVPMPSKAESCYGGHALTLEGYSDSAQHFIVANSWGKDFGDKGYCYLPYKYVLDPNLSADFWYIELMQKSG